LLGKLKSNRQISCESLATYEYNVQVLPRHDKQSYDIFI